MVKHVQSVDKSLFRPIPRQQYLFGPVAKLALVNAYTLSGLDKKLKYQNYNYF